MEYEVTLNPDLFGEDMPELARTARIQTGEFAVREFSMNEMPSEAGPAMVELEGKISFNAPVDPQDLLDAMRLTEANGTVIDIFLQTSWCTSNFVFPRTPSAPRPRSCACGPADRGRPRPEAPSGQCIQAIGNEVFQRNNSRLVEAFLWETVRFGFQYANVRGVNKNWQPIANPAHLTNIRVWLSLIQQEPKWCSTLFSALIINLHLSGTCVRDTDLFTNESFLQNFQI